jgi:endonuclease/exonuclease/phosphatase family metal-dependent hydrolase
MRPLITRVVPDLPVPDPAFFREARAAATEGRLEDHAAFLTALPALHRVEAMEPAEPAVVPERFTVAAFNAERLKFGGAARRLLERSGALVSLLSEVDIGMARSGNGHPAREIARARSEGYLYAVEFVELGLGDEDEIRDHAGETNARGFHGNAILSRLRFVEPHVIALDESAFWFPGREGVQHRVGGRIAIAARAADAPRPLWFVSVHLESKTDPADRAAQMAQLFAALDRIAPDAAVVIGGDLNTKALPADPDPAWLAAPERYEPLFAHAADAGFTWRAANLARPTQRTGPSGKPPPPFVKLDWLLTRGVRCENPRVIEAVDGEGRAISDHEMVAVDVAL